MPAPGFEPPGVPEGTFQLSGNGSSGGFSVYSVGPGAAPASNQPIVRVYALGVILTGLDAQASDQKQKDMELLITEALERGSSSKEKPELSFHRATKALIVKGTPAQQDIVAQTIDVIRDNEGLRPAGK